MQGDRSNSFAPVVDDRTRLLILGSLPGKASLAAGRYYAHPRNHFWRLVGDIVDRPLVDMVYEDRLQTLLDCGIGLWDSVESAEREGSLDTALRNVAPNALGQLAARLPALRAVGFNGGKSAAIGRPLLAARVPQVALLALPSSSPACTIPFARKRDAWGVLEPYLQRSASGFREETG